MAVVNFTGFETGDETELQAVSGTQSIQSSIKRTGDYALRTNPSTTATGYGEIGAHAANGARTAAAVATSHVAFYFRAATLPAANDEIIFEIVTSAPATKLRLRITSGGNLKAYDSAGSQIGSTGLATIATNTWYLIEVVCPSSATASVTVEVDGAADISGTGNTSTTDAGYCRFGKTANINGQTVDFYYDDVYIDDAASKPCSVERMAPSGNGNYTAWTGSYTDVDDIPHDGDTTRISSNTISTAETVALESASSAGVSGTVHAVKACAIVRENSSTFTGIAVRLRSGSTDNDSSTRNLSTSYTLSAKLHETDPATSSAWVVSALDSVEVGVLDTSYAGIACHCTMLCAMVAFEAGGGGPVIPVFMNQYRQRVA